MYIEKRECRDRNGFYTVFFTADDATIYAVNERGMRTTSILINLNRQLWLRCTPSNFLHTSSFPFKANQDRPESRQLEKHGRQGWKAGSNSDNAGKQRPQRGLRGKHQEQHRAKGGQQVRPSTYHHRVVCVLSCGHPAVAP